MSASNWTSCPRCAKSLVRAVDELRALIADKYGKVTIEEFDNLRARLKAAEDEAANPYQTLREDYEFYGAEDGEVVASYSNSCTKCGLKTEFTHRHEMDV